MLDTIVRLIWSAKVSISNTFVYLVISAIVAAATINLLVKNPSKICSNFLTKAFRETPRVSN